MSGGIALFPTETVYGVGALPTEEGVRKLVEAKQRPPGKAFQLLISDIKALDTYGAVVSPLARKVIEKFWPGPLTLVLDVEREDIPPALGRGNIGFRMPAQEVCMDLVRRCGGALAASSANLSQQPAAKSCAEAQRIFPGKIDAAIDAGELGEALASTVASVRNGDIVVIRKGAVNESLLIDLAEA
jgi:L-threonylcarbamoyladenylate synthase